MTHTLNKLEILILLKCSERNGLMSKTDFSHVLRSFDIKIKEKAMKNLAQQDFVLIQELPKHGSNKTPVFYRLTEKGQKWVSEYNKNYPK